MPKFKVKSVYSPAGDQPQAIAGLTKNLNAGAKHQVLLGVTGSGKTFTMAKVIEQVQRPTLVIAHNKTLAAQLAGEFRAFFPDNAVEYFVSYYDYYQPEAYIAGSDTYIEKETQINKEIERLRHASTAALLSRKDVIIVASVSCIYGLGSPEFYLKQALNIELGQNLDRKKMISALVDMHYIRSEVLERARFRVTGENFEIMSPGMEIVVRVFLQDGIIKKIEEVDFLTREVLGVHNQYLFFPARHFVVPNHLMDRVVGEIEKEALKQENFFLAQSKLIEAERIRRRTMQDLEMMQEVGYCSGIENYSRYLTGRVPGQPPYTLIDYFPKDYLLVVDESHVTLPQIKGMFGGDYSRKKSLVENGFRLPSAFDNRPLKFEEFNERVNQAVYVSATPADYELELTGGQVVEQIIRPTGLLDPKLEIKPTGRQVKDVLNEIKKVVKKKNRVLITTLTQKMAEDLSDYLKENQIKAEYLHAKVDTLDRIKILENLRRGKFDVLVGVNLLREGLDLPEVELVAVLDADKEGFLRSATSLVQTIGRAARNVRGRVILYADKITGSMKTAIDETNRRRQKQELYNKKHNITPISIKKNIVAFMDHELEPLKNIEDVEFKNMKDLQKHIKFKEKEMKLAAKDLQFESAALIRDEIASLRKLERQMKI